MFYVTRGHAYMLSVLVCSHSFDLGTSKALSRGTQTSFAMPLHLCGRPQNLHRDYCVFFIQQDIYNS